MGLSRCLSALAQSLSPAKSCWGTAGASSHRPDALVLHGVVGDARLMEMLERLHEKRGETLVSLSRSGKEHFDRLHQRCNAGVGPDD